MKVVVPFGFYGWGNIGDESTLQGFAALTARYPTVSKPVWIASRAPEHTARIEPAFRYYDALQRNVRGWWSRHRADVYAFAGGTPIMDVLGSYPLDEVTPIVTTAFTRRKKVAFVGVGTEKLHRDESKRLIAEIIGPRVQHWSVRSRRDLDRLVEYGVAADKITVAADMAWLLEPTTSDWGAEYLRGLGVAPGRVVVGVNVNNEPFMQKNAPNFLSNVGEFLDELIERHGALPLFLSNDVSDAPSADGAAGAMVRKSMKHADRTLTGPTDYLSPQQMFSLISCCTATVSTRYHFCLFSALQSVPFLAIERSHKVEDLCWDLEWPVRVPMIDATAAALTTAYDMSVDQRTCLRLQLEDQRLQMQTRAARNCVALEVTEQALNS
jgi:polysaccharide pyruvyl transferase WcaK-like protein